MRDGTSDAVAAAEGDDGEHLSCCRDSGGNETIINKERKSSSEAGQARDCRQAGTSPCPQSPGPHGRAAQPSRRFIYTACLALLAVAAVVLVAVGGPDGAPGVGRLLAGSAGRHGRRVMRETRRRTGPRETVELFYVPCSLRLGGDEKKEPVEHAEFFDYYRDVVEAEATRYQLQQLAWAGPDNDAVHARDTVTGALVTVIKMSVVDLANGNRLGLRSLRELRTLHRMQDSGFLPQVETVLESKPNTTAASIFLVAKRLGVDLKKATDMVHFANPNALKALLFQLLRALHAMHSAQVFHWDIRPENVLISEDCHVMLRGLGLSGYVAPHQEGSLPAEISTMPARNQWYHPPELLMRGEDWRAATWAHAVDVWSAACVFLHLVLGRPLFAAPSAVEQLIRITNELGLPTPTAGQKYSTNAQKLFHVAGTEDIFRRQRRKQRGRQLAHLPEEMRALLRRMLNLDPYRRPSVAKLLQDDAFADFSAILEVPPRTPPVTKTHLMVKIELKNETRINTTAAMQREDLMREAAWFRSRQRLAL